MAVLKMCKITICALKKNRKAVLERLQSMGVVEIQSDVESAEGFARMDTSGSRAQFERNAQMADHALAVLDEIAPEQKSMLASLEGKMPVTEDDFAEISLKQEFYKSQVNEILQAQKKIAESRSEVQKAKQQIEALQPWISLDVSMNYSGSKRAGVLIGSLPTEMSLEQIYEGIASHQDSAPAADIQIISADKNQTCLVAVCLKEDISALEEALRMMGFAKPAQLVNKIPAKQQEDLEQAIAELEKTITQSQEEIREKAAYRGALKLLSDYYRIRAQKYEVLGELVQSKRTFLISGYVAEREVSRVEKALTEDFDLMFEVQDIPEDEEAPVLLSNNAFSASYEDVVQSFGLPAKGEIDPTTIMSFFYVFFFGLMLSDAAYGLILSVACFILLKKFPRMGEGMKNMMQMFMYCGLSTLFWGVMFGGYFGDVVDVVSNTFFGHTVTIPALWFIPLNNPMRLLLYSLLFGLIHLFTGLGIKGYMMIRDGKYKDAVYDVGFWFLFLIGLLGMLIPSSLFASIAGMQIHAPAWVNTGAVVLTVAGALGILLTAGRHSKNPALRLALGAYDIYNITGWLSDILSYSRLLALGLATGVIAQVVNSMASMMGSGIVGAIVFIIIFIVGHILNLAINLLGAYVHTNRLQYVEFFGKFYEGGGRAFNPFKEDTKYIQKD